MHTEKMNDPMLEILNKKKQTIPNKLFAGIFVFALIASLIVPHNAKGNSFTGAKNTNYEASAVFQQQQN